MYDWKGKRVAFLGFGMDTQDVEAWLMEQGAVITVLDEKERTDAFVHLDRFDVLVRSPGVYRYRQEIQDAEAHGVLVTSKMQLFFDTCPTKNIIGVTGTKGKGTTSTLVYEMLKAGGKDVHLGGNIGKGVFTFLHALTSDSWVILELSSFQLIDLTVSPHIAITLMVTADHLDWHRDLDEYVRAKSTITRFQRAEDVSIFNREYPHSVHIGMQGLGEKISVAREDFTYPLRLRGDHNRENAAAAAAAARHIGISEACIRDVAMACKGLPHRLEEVGVHEGVLYYDDSIATTPETTIAALEAFSENLVLILGGSDKGADFTVLAQKIASAPHVRGLVVFGATSTKICTALAHANVRIRIRTGATSMSEAIIQARSLAQIGDVVLLSPACASFDMFHNYHDRGLQFAQAALRNS